MIRLTKLLTESIKGIRTKQASSARKMNANTRKILDYVVQKGVKGMEGKLTERPEFFVSGKHSGVRLEAADGNTYYLLYNGGRITSEGQSVGHVSLTKNGSEDVVFRIAPDDLKREYGQVHVDISEFGKAARRLRKTLKELDC